MRRAGVTLLETMIALVILGLVVTASFGLYGSALGSARSAESWSVATAYAEQGMELAKLDLAEMVGRSPEALDGGFERQVRAEPVGSGLSEITVMILFPDGGAFEVRRLVIEP
jgi:prepilin-type N-terminal cleavage/methylation domain-containing protein